MAADELFSTPASAIREGKIQKRVTFTKGVTTIESDIASTGADQQDSDPEDPQQHSKGVLMCVRVCLYNSVIVKIIDLYP